MKYRVIGISDKEIKSVCRDLLQIYSKDGKMAVGLFDEKMRDRFGYSPHTVVDAGSEEHRIFSGADAMMLRTDGEFIYCSEAIRHSIILPGGPRQEDPERIGYGQAFRQRACCKGIFRGSTDSRRLRF